MKLRRKNISTSGTIMTVALVVLIMLPLVIMTIGAFKKNASLIQVPMDLNPFKDPTAKNVARVFGESEILLWLKNSLLISVITAVATVVVGITAGYSFAKIRYRFKGFFFALVMATMMMPKQMLLVPNYLVANQLHLTDKMIGVILTSIAPAFGVFLSRQFISSLPSELFDAAEIDGCGELRKFFRVVVPLSMPAAGTIFIFSFFATFNDYIWQLIMISDKKLKTLPIGMSMFAERTFNNVALQLAMAFLATIPLVILFLACQKMFIKGATVGAVKG